MTHREYIRATKRLEAENRRKNLITGLLLLFGIIVVQVILGVWLGVKPHWGPV